MLGWVSQEQKRKNYTLGTSKEEQKNDKMGTITGTLTIELVWNKQKSQEFHVYTKNIRTINEIHFISNNKKIVKGIRNKNKGLRTEIQSLETHCQKQEQKLKNWELGTKIKELGIRNKN